MGPASKMGAVFAGFAVKTCARRVCKEQAGCFYTCAGSRRCEISAFTLWCCSRQQWWQEWCESTRKSTQRGEAEPACQSTLSHEIKDFKQVDDQGKPTCWAYNMKSGCKEVCRVGVAKKGAHICMKCLSNNHRVSTCRSNA